MRSPSKNRATFLLAIALLTVPLTPSITAEAPSAPPVLAVTTSDAGPREALGVLEHVVDEGGYEPFRSTSAGNVDRYRATIRGATEPVLVIVGHGTPSGLQVGEDTIPWETLAADIASSEAEQVILLACYSNRVGEIEGVKVLQSYEGLVDLEVAGLDGAFQLGLHNLAGKELTAYKAAHNAYVTDHGGVPHFINLKLNPERTLHNRTWYYNDHEHVNSECTAQYMNWRRGAHEVIGVEDETCETMDVFTGNLACAWQSTNCRSTSQEHKQYEQDLEDGSSANMHFNDTQTMVTNWLTVGRHVTVEETDYEIYAQLGGEVEVDDGQIIKDPNLQGSCIELAEATDLFMPYIDEDTLLKTFQERKFAGVKVDAEFEGITLNACGTIYGGIKTPEPRQDQDVTRGDVTGRVDLRVVAAIELEIELWWMEFENMESATITYPLAMEIEITHYKREDSLSLELDFEYGPPTVVLQSNTLDVYWAAEIPLLTGKSDTYYYEWDYGTSTQTAEASPGTRLRHPEVVDAAVEDALARLPSGAARVATVQEIAHDASDGGVGVPIADIVEVQPGDAFFNHLERSGALQRLGVDADAVDPGESVFLDYGNATVYDAVYGENTTRPRTLVGLEEGVAVGASTCEVRSFGAAVVIETSQCDPDRPIVGVSAIVSEWGTDDTAALAGADAPADDVRPKEDAYHAAISNAKAVRSMGENMTCISEGVTSPTSGHTYTGEEVCRIVTYGSSALEAYDLQRKVFEGHHAKVILDDPELGLFGWATDACSLLMGGNQLTEHLNTCMTLELVDDPDANVTRALTPSEVLENYHRGLSEITNMSGSNGTDSIYYQYRQDWVEDDPLTEAVHREERALCPADCAEDRVQEIECSIHRELGLDPEHCPEGSP